MPMVFNTQQHLLPIWAATDPIGEVAHILPLHHEIERDLYRDPRAGLRHPLKKERLKKEPHKPTDPEHKVDDYA